MSYCRWSSEDFQCDVYVYEDCSGGFTVHVADNKPVFKEPLPKEIPFDTEHQKEWFDRHKKVMSMVSGSKRKKIGLPHDGKTYNYDTAEEMAEFLRELKVLGYYVPEYAIENLLLDQ